MTEHFNRREFIKLTALFPWLQSCSPDEKKAIKKEKVRLGVIGTGSRGKYHLHHLSYIPHAEVVALCDNYLPHLNEAHALCPNAKTYDDYRRVLEQKEVDAVLINTPLHLHASMTIDALTAGKQVFCEKSMALTPDDCLAMYQAYQRTGKVLYVGQQRLFDPKYIHAMEMIHSGKIGDIGAIRTYWFRNNDWRREVASPELEQQINWRLYKAFSGGLMTELASHQIQVGNWALQMIPDSVMGYGDIVYWKDGREVYDSVNLIYRYSNGVKMGFESIISNKMYGLEEEILGKKGTFEMEKGKYYFEEVAPASGIMQLVKEIENKVFDQISFAGPSWAPETASKNSGYYIDGNRQGHDGTSTVGFVGDGSEELLASFCEAAITGRPAKNLVEEAYYASVLALLGIEAMEQQRTITFPDQYKIPYLNFS